MYKLIIFFSFFYCTASWANVYAWNELEPNLKYHVVNDIQLSENLTLKADSSLYFEKVFGSSVYVMIFTFLDPECTNPNFESEIALFNPEPEDTDHDKTIGVQYSKECKVNIYVEPQYYYSRSIFKY